MRLSRVEIVFKNLLTSLALLLPYIVFAQQNVPNKNVQLRNDSSSYQNQTISYKLIIANDHTYGYDVFISDNLFIHQPVIPCLSGNKGFKSKSDAKKVAVLVIEKIRKGLIPPTITIPEMQKLGIDLR